MPRRSRCLAACIEGLQFLPSDGSRCRWTSRRWIWDCGWSGLVGLRRTATSNSLGAPNSRSNPRRFASSAADSVVTPVRFPPGRLKLAIRPDLIGSSPTFEDNRNGGGGRLCGVCRNAAAGRCDHRHLTPNQVGCQRLQLIILALRPTIFDRHFPGLQYNSPPSSLRETAATRKSTTAGRHPRLRNPTTGIACCPRATTGHAAAAPPSSVMNSRLLIRSPRRRWRAATAAR